ncbi:MAG: ComF family protein [Candidatus Marinimicrobia bacterium]|nr:ComF family protein [Candidatus Neomarinimicrobiota bacterium]
MSIGRMFSRPARKIIDLIHSLIDWIYPPQCFVCGEVSDLNPFLCNQCFNKLKIFDDTPNSVVYHKDQPANLVKALFLFDKNLQKLIHEIKYRDASYVATFLGKKLGEFYKNSEFSKCDVIIPVPLYSVRKRERTYNQAACIAKGISKEWGVRMKEGLVKRRKNTNTQTKLNKQERKENIKDAFKVKNNSIIPEKVCLVDDVFTTGATTMELARTLKKVGVKKIYILCLATPLHEKEVKSKGY